MVKNLEKNTAESKHQPQKPREGSLFCQSDMSSVVLLPVVFLSSCFKAHYGSKII